MERKEFEAFVEEKLDEIREEWVKYYPGTKTHLSLCVFDNSVSGFAFDEDGEDKIVDFWGWRNDADS